MSKRRPVEHRLAAPAGEICWFEWGAAGQGASLLLLHATGFHARCWDRVVASLSPETHIVAPDLRGHGRSFQPGTLSDWGLIADDIGALLAGFGSHPFLVVGHSMGGFISALLAARMPDAVRRLLLVDPVLLPPEWYHDRAAKGPFNPEDHPVSRRRRLWSGPDEMFDHFSDRLPYSRWVPGVLRDYCDHGLRPNGDGGFELSCLPRLEASAYLGNAGCDIYPVLKDVRCPVTVLRARNGERTSAIDFSISPTWPELAGQFHDGHDLHWSDLTHFIPMEAPERLAALIAAQLSEQQG